MPDYYCDSDAADNLGAATSWATARQSIESVWGLVSAGDRVFCRAATGGYDFFDGTSVTLDTGNVADEPIYVYACKDGTSAEPPTTSDLVADWSDSDGGRIAATGNSSLLIQKSVYFYGFELDGTNSMSIGTVGGGGYVTVENCKLTWASGASGSQNIVIGSGGTPSKATLKCINTDIQWESGTGDTQGEISLARSGTLEMYGGSLDVGSHTNSTIITGDAGRVYLDGVDLSSWDSGSRIMDTTTGASETTVTIEVKNCKWPTGGSLIIFGDSADRSPSRYGYMMGCGDDTTLTTGESAQQYLYSDRWGDVSNDTKSRTGGATDGATGAWSFAMDIGDGRAFDGSDRGLRLPWLERWVAGDGTSKTLTIYFCREGASSAPTALQNDEVYLEVMYPSAAAGTDANQYTYYSSAISQLATPTNIATDSTSTWSGTVANQTKQKLSTTISPDYEGVVRARLVYSKNITTPGADDTIYVDPVLEVI